MLSRISHCCHSTKVIPDSPLFVAPKVDISRMSEEQVVAAPSDVDALPEEGMFNVADIVVFVLFVLGLVGFYLYKKYQESNVVQIKPISLA